MVGILFWEKIKKLMGVEQSSTPIKYKPQRE